MASRAIRSDGPIRDKIIAVLNEEDEPMGISELMASPEMDDRESVKTVLRRMIRDGEIATTSDWNYKLATRLKK